MDDPGGTNTNGGDASIETLLARLQRQSSRQGVNGNASQAQASAVAQLTDQLHSQSSSTSQSRAPSQSYFPFSTPTQASRPQHASVSSPIVSPPPGGPEPHHPSAVMSPNVGTPNTASSAPGGGQTGGDRTSTLLNLLKFSQPSSSPRSTPAPRQAQQEAGSGAANSGYGAGKVEQTQAAQNAHGRGISASDLVASLMGKNAAPASRDPSSQPTQRINQPELTRETGDGASSPTADTQDLLLKLLNRPKPQQSGASAARRASGQASSPDRTSPEAVIDDLSQDFADASLEKVPSGPSDPRKSQRANQQATATPERKENTKQETTRGMFTYVNPFEQLAASSPRNRTPKAGTPRSGTPRSGNVTPIFEILKPSRGAAVDPEGTIDHGQKSKEHSPTPTQPSSMKRAFAGGDHVQQAMSSPPPAPLPDGRSQLEALIGIGASKKPNAESVSHALNEIGGKIGQEVEGALAKADKEWSENDETRTSEAVERIAVDELEDEIQEAAAEMKEELDKPENQGVLEETMPEPVAEAVKDVIDTAARENIADTWESGDTEEGLREAEDTRIIKVLNFPLRPFVSITLRPLTDALPSFRQDYVMDIARLKKEFDQVDRTLATASKDYIVYSITKHGGLRVIRQDDGQDKQIFTQTKDRIFNVAASTAARGSASHGTESVIGTGVSGSVYWVNLARPDKDLWDVENSESNGFVLPPIPSPDEGTSGGLLKTRARSSSRHPEFFAVGRGKSIHIIWPNVAQTPRYLRNQKDRTVDTVKYLEERSLKVTTGKAGKDFAFSEDDTTIASLDKLGRLRFWDIRALVNASHGALDVTAPKVSVEIATPLMTFSTTQPAEKAWPSSVHFVDKIRPFTRGTAVRYLIVGMKQNHTLQLWDLALGKPVQELRFPHGNESDAICSILFHAPSGIIVVGHPTRNSIFFVHLSAPRYNMTSMTQARYLERLAQGDPLLPKPEATAIMSGVREISFASKGKLRSLDILQQPNSVAEGADSPVLFELYAMHSKGVSCLTVKREDFGWGSDNRVLHPVDAEREGAVTIEELRQPIPPSAGEVASAADQAPTTAVNNVPPPSTAKPAPKEIQRKPAAKPVQPSTSPARAEGKAGSAASTISNGVHETLTKNADKAEKKKKKRADDDDVISRGTEASQPVNTHSSKALVQSQAQDEKPVASPSLERPSVSTNADVSTVNLGVSGDFMNKEIRKIEKAVSAEFSKTMSKELNTLYQRFNEDKRIMQAAGDAKQDAVLRLVSSTLSENVEKSLARIIGQTVQQAVVPSIAEVTAATLNQTLSQVVRDHLEHALPREIRSAVPDAIGRVFQSADLLRSISNHVSSKVGAHVESDFAAVLQGTITPAFKELALTAAHSVAGEVERRTAEQLRKAEEVRQRDVRKVESLHELVRGLTQTVTRMASSQADFQREILKLNRHVSHPQPRQEEKSRGPSRQQHEGLPQRNEQPAQAEQTPEQEELELIASTMREGRYEEATIRWLQSQQQVDLFDRFFIRFGPAYVQTLSQLVLLSVAASVTASFDTNVNERLDWVEACFSSLNFRDAEVRDVLPRIIDVLVQRLESLYMRLAQKSLQDPALRKIPGLTTLARELKNNALQVA